MTGWRRLFNPYNIFNGLWSRFLSSLFFFFLSSIATVSLAWPRFAPILFLLPLVLPRSVVPRLLGFTLGAPLLPGIHFHAFSWAASLWSFARPVCPSFSLSVSFSPRASRRSPPLSLPCFATRFNYQLFRVSLEFALAPPPLPGVDSGFFRARFFITSFSSSGRSLAVPRATSPSLAFHQCT